MLQNTLSRFPCELAVVAWKSLLATNFNFLTRCASNRVQLQLPFWWLFVAEFCEPLRRTRNTVKGKFCQQQSVYVCVCVYMRENGFIVWNVFHARLGKRKRRIHMFSFSNISTPIKPYEGIQNEKECFTEWGDKGSWDEVLSNEK